MIWLLWICPPVAYFERKVNAVNRIADMYQHYSQTNQYQNKTKEIEGDNKFEVVLKQEIEKK